MNIIRSPFRSLLPPLPPADSASARLPTATGERISRGELSDDRENRLIRSRLNAFALTPNKSPSMSQQSARPTLERQQRRSVLASLFRPSAALHSFVNRNSSQWRGINPRSHTLAAPQSLANSRFHFLKVRCCVRECNDVEN